MNTLFFGLVGASALISLLIASWLANYRGSDAAGNGLTQAFTALAAVVLWLLLAALVAVSFARGGWPGRARFYAVPLLAVILAGQFAAFTVLNGEPHGAFAEGAVRAVVLLSPWLVMLACLGTNYAVLRGLQPATVAALTLFSLLPWLMWAPMRKQAIEHRAAVDQAYQAEKDKLEFVRNLPDDTPVQQLLTYTDVPGMFSTDLPEEARRRIRTLPRRQEEIQALLEQGSDLALVQLNCFDVAVTPGICLAARQGLGRMAGKWRSNAAKVAPVPADMVGPIRFLLSRGCACDKELDGLQDAMQAAPDSFEKTQFLRDLVRIRANRGADQ